MAWNFRGSLILRILDSSSFARTNFREFGFHTSLLRIFFGGLNVRVRYLKVTKTEAIRHFRCLQYLLITHLSTWNYNSKRVLRCDSHCSAIYGAWRAEFRSLRSSTKNLLMKLVFNLKSYGGRDRSFVLASAVLWNDLPQSLKDSQSAETS